MSGDVQQLPALGSHRTHQALTLVHRSATARRWDQSLIHFSSSGRFGGLPCISNPTRKIRPAAHTTAYVVAINSATDSRICHSGGPGGITMRRIIANGVIVGNMDKPTASPDSGARI